MSEPYAAACKVAGRYLYSALGMKDTKLITDILVLQQKEKPTTDNYYKEACEIWEKEYMRVRSITRERSVSPEY